MPAIEIPLLPKWLFRSLLEGCAVGQPRVCALSHLIQHETVQPEICRGFHEDEFDPGSVGIYPPYVGKFNRQGLMVIGE